MYAIVHCALAPRDARVLQFEDSEGWRTRGLGDQWRWRLDVNPNPNPNPNPKSLKA